MARVSKFGIASLLFGLILLYFDQGSDIWNGVNFYNACHYRWALTSFLLTSMPTIVAIFYFLFAAIYNTNWESLIMILFATFFPLVSLIVAFIVINERNDENVPVLKYFMVAEVVFEATGQFIFNVYVRAILVPTDGNVQFASIVLSYIAIIYGLGDKYAVYYRDESMPSIQHVFISMCIIISDATLKLSVILLSLLINGINVTIGCVAALVVLLAIANLILTWKYPDSIEDNNDTGGDFKFNLFEMLFLVLTNLPHNVSLIIKNISLRIAINKSVTYVIFGIGLSIMTGKN